MSDAALLHAHCNVPAHADSGPATSSYSNMGSLRSYTDEHPGVARMSTSPTSPPQPSVPGRLTFAHSVTPHISSIGRRLASEYAVNFESCRLRAPSQELASHDLELLYSPSQEDQ